MTHGVNTSMEPVQLPGPKPVVDRVFPETELDELAPSHHPMLPRRQFRDPRIHTAKPR
jgi:hypothetical protein